MSEKCRLLHQWFNQLRRRSFPYNGDDIPSDGIYILFEKNEKAHGTDRVVRVGTHNGKGQLRSRLKQHFLNENKDRSIFRKNIGRAILAHKNDPFLEQWNLDLTTRKAKEKYKGLVDFYKQKKVEEEVTKYIRGRFSFVVFSSGDKVKRLSAESKIISTLSGCGECRPSSSWLGLFSPKEKIRKSGLWLVNELNKEELSDEEMKELKDVLKSGW